MNIKGRFARNAGWAIFCFFVVFTVFSCKDNDPTIAEIKVVDRNSLPIQGATVTLWQDTAVNNVNGVQSTLRVTKESDAAGMASFEFDLEAFLNVEVIKGPDSGKSFIRLERHETVSATVTLN
jgi:hypothetical protein